MPDTGMTASEQLFADEDGPLTTGPDGARELLAGSGPTRTETDSLGSF